MRASVVCILCVVGVLGSVPVPAPEAVCTSRPRVVAGQGESLHRTQTPTPVECCDQCQRHEGCKAWAYDGTAHGCWLHSALAALPLQSAGPPLPQTPAQPPPRAQDFPSGPEACSPGTNGTQYPFCDATLSHEQRLADLVSRVAVDEMASQLTARQSAPIARLGLPSYYWGTNAIHGMQNVECVNSRCPTSFPAPCALAAAFNTSLVRDMGNVIGRELRAYYNAQIHNSLDTWSPTINVNRDPRWGRNVESPGEDPFVCGSYGTAYAQGLQQYTGEEAVVQAVVTLKHWLAYSIENYRGVTRYNVDVEVSAYDLAHTYMPPWEQAVREGKALGVMCSYNAVNGRPTCGNPALNATLRHDWGFRGYVTSDTDSCECIIKGHPKGHGGAPRPTNGTDATRQCLMGGTDIDSGGTYRRYLAAAVRGGELDARYARRGLTNAYRMRMRLGLFDPSADHKYRHIPLTEVGSATHQRLSLGAARKALVLLKRGPLPFPKGTTVAVIGQAVTNTMSLTGNYDGPLCPEGGAACFPSIAQAVAKANAGGRTRVVAGTAVPEAVAAARAAEQVVLVVDNWRDGGSEGRDRESIGLSAPQLALATAVIAANRRTVLVLVSGGLISIDDLKETAPAILQAFMPGVHGGTAIADALFGDVNPGGKLPVTMYHSSYVHTADFLSMAMTNRSYKYYTGVPLYPFGYGLSYTEFRLDWAAPPPPLHVVRDEGERAAVYEVTVTNIGRVAGDEVVLAFTRPLAHTLRASLGDGVPIERQKLFAFERVALAAGQSAVLAFRVGPQQLAMVDADGHTALHKGEFDVVFSRGHGAPLMAKAAVARDSGAPQRLKSFRKWW